MWFIYRISRVIRKEEAFLKRQIWFSKELCLTNIIVHSRNSFLM